MKRRVLAFDTISTTLIGGVSTYHEKVIPINVELSFSTQRHGRLVQHFARGKQYKDTTGTTSWLNKHKPTAIQTGHGKVTVSTTLDPSNIDHQKVTMKTTTNILTLLLLAGSAVSAPTPQPNLGELQARSPFSDDWGVAKREPFSDDWGVAKRSPFSDDWGVAKEKREAFSDDWGVAKEKREAFSDDWGVAKEKREAFSDDWGVAKEKREAFSDDWGVSKEKREAFSDDWGVAKDKREAFSDDWGVAK
ncbi:hypothetical protein H2198_004884 [Neophaeococcomyces mojaviensis]|uniref:Uncharacterized protein n=1 Tax=Neophaeococcomyces mojaviensis TaxID=3383035 RepID=A0ACC3A7L5_9EURO|nr:hypothetical protein H2198_004884 [Knufia sp. JES_112]